MTTTCTIAEYLNIVKFERNLKNDAALARALDVNPPTISKLRNGVLPLSPFIMLRLHERLNMDIHEMREMIHAEEFSVDARLPDVQLALAGV